MMKKSLAVRAAAVGGAGILGFLFLFSSEGSILREIGDETARLVSRGRPATVNLLTRPRYSPGDPFPDEETPPPQIDRHLRLPLRGKRSSGTGFFISGDGLILTAETVVAGAGEIVAVTSDGRTLPARLVGRESHFNLALLKVEGEDHPYLELGDSRLLKEGHLVVAVGNPFGLFSSPAVGIVSGLGRSGLGTAPYEDLIQITAAVNPGDAGGPLLNWRGEVVGLITAALFPPRVAPGERFSFPARRSAPFPFDFPPADPPAGLNPAQGVGFAVTSELVGEVLDRLRGEERRPFGWLGVTIESPPARTGLKPAVLIREVLPASPAEKSGLRSGDLIEAVDSIPIRRPLDLQRAVLFSSPGRTIKLEVVRGDRGFTLPAVLGAKPPGMETPRPGREGVD